MRKDKRTAHDSGTATLEVEKTTGTAQIVSPAEDTQSGQAEAVAEPEVTRDQLALGRRLLNWRTLVPLVIVVIALVFVAQKANINLPRTWAAIQHANMLFFLAAFLVYYLSFAIRGARWKVLLRNVGYTPENGIRLPGLYRLIEIVFISFFANAVVPAKLGDLYRAYMLRQDIGVSTTRSFGTVLAERLLDLIVLLLMFIPALLFSLHEAMPPQLALGMQLLLAAVIIGIAGLFVMRWAREPLAKLVPVRFREQYYHFQEGTLGSFRRVPLLTLLTVGVWCCEALRFFFIALALHLIPGSAGDILAAAIFIGLGEALLTVIPATGGGIGLVEGGMAAMIALFYTGPDLVNLTAAAIVLDRTITLFSVLAIGFILFLIAFGRGSTGKKR